MIQVQITLMSTTGYKAVSCIIEVESRAYLVAHKAEVQKQGITKICQKRYWNNSHLRQYGYTKCKMREYDKEKIAKENAERYEQIKKERGWVKEES